VAQQQQRRPVGPLQVVQHQQDRPAGGDGAEPLPHGLEQPLALGVGIVGQRWAHAADAGRDVGQEAGQLARVLGDLGPQPGPRAGGGVGAERLPQGLVGGEALLVPAAVEDRAAPGVHPQRQLGRHRRLADARIPGHDHDPALAVQCGPPRRLQPGDRLVPADDQAGRRPAGPAQVGDGGALGGAVAGRPAQLVDPLGHRAGQRCRAPVDQVGAGRQGVGDHHRGGGGQQRHRVVAQGVVQPGEGVHPAAGDVGLAGGESHAGPPGGVERGGDPHGGQGGVGGHVEGGHQWAAGRLVPGHDGATGFLHEGARLRRVVRLAVDA
jgi:hypothetical protein